MSDQLVNTEPNNQVIQQPIKRVWKLDKTKFFFILIIIVLLVCVIESIIMKRRSTRCFDGPQTYIDVYVYIDGVKIPVTIYNKHNITDSDKRRFKEFKYKTTPKILIGDKTIGLVKSVKESFGNITSINAAIDSGLTTLSNVVTLKQPNESKYRVVSNTPLREVFTDGKRIFFR